MSRTLSVIAAPGRGVPDPYGPVAFALSLPTEANVVVRYVHSLPPNSNAVQLDIQGTITLGPVQASQALANSVASIGQFGTNQNDTVAINETLLKLPNHPPAYAPTLTWLTSLEQQLTLRTYLVGHSITLADYLTWGSLKMNSIAQKVLSKFVHVERWYNHMSTLSSTIQASQTLPVQAKLKPTDQTDQNQTTGGTHNKKNGIGADGANATFELGLPNAIQGQVVTRLPPEPSGYLHIGHAKAAILNQYFAKMYKGKFLVRFDDTNPSKEKAEFEQSIIEDLALLGLKPDSQSYTSDYFDQLHIYCVQMIKQGHAYADDTEQEKMREERMNGTPSSRRDSSIEDNLSRFAEMATGSNEGCRWCIRAKISTDDPNKAMRDPVIYRCNLLPHHRTGSKYKMYPTYDFACPIVDSIEGVTHALRTNEYRDRNPQYYWMLDSLKLRRVEVWDFGRLNFVYTLLSKRKLKWFVEQGLVSGWDDPRFPTVRGIRRRGMTIEAINQFMLLQGPSQAFITLEWDVIWNINKKVIDPISPRHTALIKKDLVKVICFGQDCPKESFQKSILKHKKNESVGTKLTSYDSIIFIEQQDAQTFDQDEELTLMDWGNAFVRKIEKDNNNLITSISMELNLKGDFKKTKKKITWLASIEEKAPLINIKLKDYDYLITKKKLEEQDQVENLLNPQTEFVVEALADYNVKQLNKGEIIQFERKGYYIVDQSYENDETFMEFICIPDGRANSIALKHKVENTTSSTSKSQVDVQKGNKTKSKKTSTETTTGQLPLVAPTEPVETILLSEGTKGFDIPIKTKMYKIDPIDGQKAYETPVETKMHHVSSIHQD
ncbi:glutamate--tRNA ligase [Microbotryomycetes sp. JL221]|nr:glutamate--tRNA ligase [Microbotryomycetes sp. JL221]